MERPDINKNKQRKRANMKMFCVTPHPEAVEENSTSIYEINIESDIEFLLNSGRGRLKVVPVGQPRVSVQDSTLERRKEVMERDLKNPFIESYYPILELIRPAETEPVIKGMEEIKEVMEEPKEDNESSKEEKASLKEEKESIKEEKENPRVEKESSREEKESFKEEKPSFKEEKPSFKEEKPSFKEVKECSREVKECSKEEKESPKEEKANPKVEKANSKEEKAIPKKEKESPKKEKGSLKEEKEKKVIETADKENQSPSLHLMDEFRERAKNRIIRSFMANQFLDMKSIMEEREGNGLHFHHHEHHHHHYHMNEKWDDDTFSDTALETFCRMFKKGRRKGKDEGFRANSPVRKEHSDTSSSTFTKFTDEPRIPRDVEVLRVIKDLKKANEPKESKVYPKESGLLHPRLSSSVDTISDRKSELLHSHIFSDTELSKLDDLNILSGSFDVESNSTGYAAMVENLRSLNNLKSPVVITDQKTVPKFSYITCECNSNPGSDTSSEAFILNAGSHQEEVWLKENDSKQSSDSDPPNRNTEPPTVVTVSYGGVSPPQISYQGNLLCNFAQKDAKAKIMKNSSKLLQYEIWNASILGELREIKKKIKRIEKRRWREKQSFLSHRSDEQCSNTKPTHPVTIYSNRTFIVAKPKNVCLVSWWRSSGYEG